MRAGRCSIYCVGPFDNAGHGWSTQASGDYKRGPGGLCKEDGKHFAFSQLPKCKHGSGCNYRHMAEATEGGEAWCTDRSAAHRADLVKGMPNLAAYTQSGAFEK